MDSHCLSEKNLLDDTPPKARLRKKQFVGGMNAFIFLYKISQAITEMAILKNENSKPPMTKTC